MSDEEVTRSPPVPAPRPSLLTRSPGRNPQERDDISLERYQTPRPSSHSFQDYPRYSGSDDQSEELSAGLINRPPQPQRVKNIRPRSTPEDRVDKRQRTYSSSSSQSGNTYVPPVRAKEHTSWKGVIHHQAPQSPEEVLRWREYMATRPPGKSSSGTGMDSTSYAMLPQSQGDESTPRQPLTTATPPPSYAAMASAPPSPHPKHLAKGCDSDRNQRPNSEWYNGTL